VTLSDDVRGDTKALTDVLRSAAVANVASSSDFADGAVDVEVVRMQTQRCSPSWGCSGHG
jgi:hypothetical protein